MNNFRIIRACSIVLALAAVTLSYFSVVDRNWIALGIDLSLLTINVLIFIFVTEILKRNKWQN